MFYIQMDVLRQEIFLQKLATGMEKVLKSPRFLPPPLLSHFNFCFSLLLSLMLSIFAFIYFTNSFFYFHFPVLIFHLHMFTFTFSATVQSVTVNSLKFNLKDWDALLPHHFHFCFSTFTSHIWVFLIWSSTAICSLSLFQPPFKAKQWDHKDRDSTTTHQVSIARSRLLSIWGSTSSSISCIINA